MTTPRTVYIAAGFADFSPICVCVVVLFNNLPSYMVGNLRYTVMKENALLCYSEQLTAAVLSVLKKKVSLLTHKSPVVTLKMLLELFGLSGSLLRTFLQITHCCLPTSC